MKNLLMSIGLIVAVGALIMNMAMPISLADSNIIEIEGKLSTRENVSSCAWKIGELHKGDEIKVVITKMSGDTPIKITVANTTATVRKTIVDTLEDIMPLPLCWPCDWFLCPSYCLLLDSMPTNINETIFAFEGEKSFIVPEDGVYVVGMDIEKGTVLYKGYIEIIRTEQD